MKWEDISKSWDNDDSDPIGYMSDLMDNLKIEIETFCLRCPVLTPNVSFAGFLDKLREVDEQ